MQIDHLKKFIILDKNLLSNRSMLLFSKCYYQIFLYSDGVRWQYRSSDIRPMDIPVGSYDEVIYENRSS